jgi:hypothetical protein
MSSNELQYYLMSTGLFKVIDGISELPPTKYKGFTMGRVDIEVIRHNYGEKEQWVHFTFGGFNLFACHKLKDLDFTTLYKELNKIYGFDPKFIQWSKIELRNYNIEQLL